MAGPSWGRPSKEKDIKGEKLLGKYYIFLMPMILFLCLYIVIKRIKVGKTILKIGSYFNPAIFLPISFLVGLFFAALSLMFTFEALSRVKTISVINLHYFNILTTLFWILLCIFGFFTFFRKKAICNNGIISPGKFVLWRDIKSYKWQNDSMLILKFKLNFFGLKRPISENWIIPAKDKAEVEKQLKSHIQKRIDELIY